MASSFPDSAKFRNFYFKILCSKWVPMNVWLTPYRFQSDSLNTLRVTAFDISFFFTFLVSKSTFFIEFWIEPHKCLQVESPMMFFVKIIFYNQTVKVLFSLWTPSISKHIRDQRTVQTMGFRRRIYVKDGHKHLYLRVKVILSFRWYTKGRKITLKYNLNFTNKKNVFFFLLKGQVFIIRSFGTNFFINLFLF